MQKLSETELNKIVEAVFNGEHVNSLNEDYWPEQQGYVKLGDGTFADSGMIVARKDAPDKVAGEIKSVMRDDSKPGAWQMITLTDGSDENPLDYVLHATNKVPGLVPEPGTVDDEGSLIEGDRNLL